MPSLPPSLIITAESVSSGGVGGAGSSFLLLSFSMATLAYYPVTQYSIMRDILMPTNKQNRTKPLTQKRFERLLGRVFTVPKDDQEVKQTSVDRPSDGCSGKRKNQGKTEGAEG